MQIKIRGVYHQYKKKIFYFLKLHSETTMATETTKIALSGRKGFVIIKLLTRSVIAICYPILNRPFPKGYYPRLIFLWFFLLGCPPIAAKFWILRKRDIAMHFTIAVLIFNTAKQTFWCQQKVYPHLWRTWSGIKQDWT